MTTIAAAGNVSPSDVGDYIYSEVREGSGIYFNNEIRDALHAPERTTRTLERVFLSLSEEQKLDPNVQNELAILAEAAISVQATIHYDEISEDDEWSEAIIDEANRMLALYEAMANQSRAEYIRPLRSIIRIWNDEPDLAEFGPLGRLDNIDRVTFATPFASIIIDSRNLDDSIEWVLDRSPLYREHVEPEPIDFVYTLFLRYWSIAAIFVAIVLWVNLIVKLKKKLHWLIPLGASVIFISVNMTLINISGVYAADETELIAEYPNAISIVSIQTEYDGQFWLRLPIDVINPNDFVVFDIDDNPLPSKYNTFTGTIDALVSGGGVYRLEPHFLFFRDIGDQSREVQQAITILTTRGLMHASEENYFLPGREITRAEFLSAIVDVMGILDETASSTFTDVLETDWFYAVAATAQSEGFAAGFEDGTFRGNSPIPKEQMVHIAATVLIRMAQYSLTGDVDEILMKYTDYELLGRWSRNHIALATEAGIVISRRDQTFTPESVMTRGDAAIIIYRLFLRVW